MHSLQHEPLGDVIAASMYSDSLWGVELSNFSLVWTEMLDFSLQYNQNIIKMYRFLAKFHLMMTLKQQPCFYWDV